MLNSSLLKYRCSGGRLTIKFVEPDAEMMNLGSALLEIYSEAFRKKLPRSVLDEQLDPFIKNPHSGKVAAGLNKVIVDHSLFAGSVDSSEAPQQREMIFKTAARFLPDPPDDPALFRNMVAQELPQSMFLSKDIYRDLPEFDILEKIPDWNALELCNAYNTALVQGVLLYAEKLELTVEDPEPMVLRKFMRRLKFYRLLAEVERASATAVKLTLSGPAALFGENRKYGLQLAAFFQVILLLKNWSLKADVKIHGERTDTLTLSSKKCDLKSPIRRWTECLPDEVAMFIRAFRNDPGAWREAPEAPLPRIATQGAFFPDFSFERIDEPGRVVHVELFHRYYHEALEKRLDFLQQMPDFPLVVGVDRAALGKDGERQLAEKYADLADKLFFFSNYPGVDRVRKMLEKTYQSSVRLI